MRLLAILIFGLLVVSCKKDKLEDEKAIFIGTWNWEYTHHVYGWCDNSEMEETLTPITENTTFKLEFLEKGIVNYYLNDTFIEKYRLKFTLFDPDSQHCGLLNADKFGITLDNKKNSVLGGCINQDTIALINFEKFLFHSEEGCESYINYFVLE